VAVGTADGAAVELPQAARSSVAIRLRVVSMKKLYLVFMAFLSIEE
jgi:hypothetical protein